MLILVIAYSRVDTYLRLLAHARMHDGGLHGFKLRGLSRGTMQINGRC